MLLIELYEMVEPRPLTKEKLIIKYVGSQALYY